MELGVREIILVVGRIGTEQLLLAVLAEEFVAFDAFHGREGEIETHDALDLLDHFPLQLVRNQWHFNVEGGNGLGSHNLLNRLI